LPIWEAKTFANDLLSISGPALFSGYVSGGRFFARTADWHPTSDRVTLEGREISPLGRADSLVKVLGELVDPEAIERELISQSQGRLYPATIAVIAIPDERAGCALVPVFDNSVDPQLFADALAHFEKNTAGFKRLKPAVLIENFPRSELGKLRRSELAAILQK
jgi:O-succinylbenzoic acid--CoA ligase